MVHVGVQRSNKDLKSYASRNRAHDSLQLAKPVAPLSRAPKQQCLSKSELRRLAFCGSTNYMNLYAGNTAEYEYYSFDFML